MKVSLLTQKYKKHIRVHSLSVEILCFTIFNNSLVPRVFLKKIGRGVPSQFPERKIANELASTSNQSGSTYLNAVLFHVKSHEQWLFVIIS